KRKFTLILDQSLQNPGTYNYLPFLPAVIAGNILFGAGFALLATALSLFMADYLYLVVSRIFRTFGFGCAPLSNLLEPAWQPIALFASFGAIGRPSLGCSCLL